MVPDTALQEWPALAERNLEDAHRCEAVRPGGVGRQPIRRGNLEFIFDGREVFLEHSRVGGIQAESSCESAVEVKLQGVGARLPDGTGSVAQTVHLRKCA